MGCTKHRCSETHLHPRCVVFDSGVQAAVEQLLLGVDLLQESLGLNDLLCRRLHCLQTHPYPLTYRAHRQDELLVRNLNVMWSVAACWHTHTHARNNYHVSCHSGLVDAISGRGSYLSRCTVHTLQRTAGISQRAWCSHSPSDVFVRRR